MKFKAAILSLVMMTAGTLPAFARSAGDQGIGLMVGTTNGIAGKFWFSDKIAMDLGAGVNQGDLGVQADLLFHDFGLLKELSVQSFASDWDFPVYIGAGPRVLFRDNEEFGIRFPAGIAFLPHQQPWEFFTEIAPILRFTPDTGVDFDFLLGARYYFDAIHPRQ